MIENNELIFTVHVLVYIRHEAAGDFTVFKILHSLR